MGKIKSLSGVAVLLLFSSIVQAEIIYDTGLPNNSQWRNSDYSNQFIGQSADDFILSVDSSLTGISWYGSYLFTQTQPMPDDFAINIYSDAVNNPSTLFHSATLSSDVIRTFTGDTVDIGSQEINMYQYDVDISSVSLMADTRYWLSIVNNTSDTTQYGGWAWAYNQESNTHRWLREDGGLYSGEWRTYGSGNLAFSLNDDPTSVPVPPIFALMGAGLIGLGFARRKAKK